MVVARTEACTVLVKVGAVHAQASGESLGGLSLDPRLAPLAPTRSRHVHAPTAAAADASASSHRARTPLARAWFGVSGR